MIKVLEIDVKPQTCDSDSEIFVPLIVVIVVAL